MKASTLQSNLANACGQLSWLIAATSCALVAEIDELGRNDHHPVAAIATRQARQRHPARCGDVVHGGAAGREVEALRAELGLGRG